MKKLVIFMVTSVFLIGACGSKDKQTSVTTTTAKPVTTTTAKPVTTTTAKPVTTTTAKPVVDYKTAGSFCSPAGATGTTKNGIAVTCKTSDTDSRNRWRA